MKKFKVRGWAGMMSNLLAKFHTGKLVPPKDTEVHQEIHLPATTSFTAWPVPR